MLQLIQRVKIDAEREADPAQQIQCEGFFGKTSCPHCRYASSALDSDAFQSCMNRNQCAEGTAPWMWLQPFDEDAINESVVFADGNVPLYTKTRVMRQVKIDGMPVYLQLVQCNADGYRCNSMCHYYAERLKNKQTAAKCAAAKACGLNGSFWCLTIPSFTYFRKMLQWNGDAQPVCTYSESLSLTNLQISRTPYGERIYALQGFDPATPSQRNLYRIKNNIEGSADNGKYLFADGTWKASVYPSIIREVEVSSAHLEFAWFLVYHGLKKQIIYPESLW